MEEVKSGDKAASHRGYWQPEEKDENQANSKAEKYSNWDLKTKKPLSSRLTLTEVRVSKLESLLVEHLQAKDRDSKDKEKWMEPQKNIGYHETAV
jgi:hypothetical protein